MSIDRSSLAGCLLTLFLLLSCFRIGICQASTVQVDAEFPGGNIVFERIDGNDVYMHQDLWDTEGDWFYWYFRVRGAKGRTLRFHFTKSNVIGVLGPAVSLDEGDSWSWMGTEPVQNSSFEYTFEESTKEVRFSFGMPYTSRDLTEFLKGYEDHPHLEVGELCKSREGRTVEYLRIGKIDGIPRHRVLLTCRHHACEMMANYVLEGIIRAVLDLGEMGRWFCGRVEFFIVPFMDKDGVEDGDQGKNRKPHDHNRDYAGRSMYPSVRSLRKRIPMWSDGKLRFALDLHNPYIRGTHNEVIYFVGTPNGTIWRQVGCFSRILESVQNGPLKFNRNNNLPFGEAWNTAENYKSGKSCSRWAGELKGISFASTLEIPYANASGEQVTAKTARLFGVDLARALRVYLEGHPYQPNE